MSEVSVAQRLGITPIKAALMLVQRQTTRLEAAGLEEKSIVIVTE